MGGCQSVALRLSRCHFLEYIAMKFFGDLMDVQMFPKCSEGLLFVQRTHPKFLLYSTLLIWQHSFLSFFAILIVVLVKMYYSLIRQHFM